MADKEQHPNASARAAVVDELSGTLGGRDITRGFVNGSVLDVSQDRVFVGEAGGRIEVYQGLLTDDQVGSAFQQRRLAVRSRDWEVQPGGDSAQDKQAAEFLTEQLQHIGWDNVTDKMLFGIFYGYAVSECLWARDGRHVVLDKIKVRDRSRFAWDQAGQLRLKTLTNSNPGEEMPDRKFWTFRTGADHDDAPYGIGLGHWLYWPVWFKRNGIKYWLIFLDRFAQPVPLGEYPSTLSADDPKVTKLIEALQAIHTDSVIAIPEGMKVELLEAARSGTADYGSLCAVMNAAIAKVVVGQTASSEGTAGKLGDEELQGDVRTDIVKADADLVCESFDLTVGRWLTEWNYPRARTPRVWRKIDDAEDINKVADRDGKIFQMGYRPTLAHIKDTYGGDWELQPTGRAGGEGAEFAEEKGESPVDAIGDQRRQLQGLGDKAVGDWISRIKEDLAGADTLAAFSERLEALGDAMSDDQFATIMTGAFAASRLAGRFDIDRFDPEKAIG